MSLLKQNFAEIGVAELMKQLGDSNRMAVPRVSRIVISMGVKNAASDRKKLDEAIQHLAAISGQKPVISRAKKSIAGFRLREGMEVGCFVTLRGKRAFEFLERLIFVALPRVRDFRGLSNTAFDGRGNYGFGLSEQTVFPEIDSDKVTHIQGMNVAIVTTAGSDERGRQLLKVLGFPFQKEALRGRN